MIIGEVIEHGGHVLYLTNYLRIVNVNNQGAQHGRGARRAQVAQQEQLTETLFV